jgi:hypothetical protein
MSRHQIALIFYGFGILAILFSLARTYYIVWKIRKQK